MEAPSMQFGLVTSAVMLSLVATVVGFGGMDRAEAQAAAVRPARLHAGSCDDLGAVASELTGLGAESVRDGTPVPAPETVGPATALPVALSETEVEASVTAIVEGGHALTVYESVEVPDRVIACGDVGGPL